MKKYNWIAPFSGTVVEVFAEPGSVVSPGVQVAKIAESGDYEVKVPIGLDELEIYSSQNQAVFTDANGKEVGTGKILRVSDVINQQTQSADVYYSVTPLEGTKIYHGLFVNVSINQKAEKETMALPRVAVSDNSVRILAKGKLLEKDILVVGSIPDTVFVTGLNNGQMVLLEQVDESQDKVTYEGIER
jgi:multidrug efflux pump subunit AcrA (membrane-fusion protein)